MQVDGTETTMQIPFYLPEAYENIIENMEDELDDYKKTTNIEIPRDNLMAKYDSINVRIGKIVQRGREKSSTRRDNTTAPAQPAEIMDTRIKVSGIGKFQTKGPITNDRS